MLSELSAEVNLSTNLNLLATISPNLNTMPYKGHMPQAAAAGDAHENWSSRWLDLMGPHGSVVKKTGK